MKNYRQLIKELPSKKVVMAFGRFQPPTTGHELLVNAVKKIAQKQDADHVIFASKTQDKKSNPLPVDRKVYYLKRMFPKTNFVAANEHIRTFIEAATELSKKYKHLIMLAGSDRVPEYKRLLERYNGDVFNFETIEVVSAGERDPDADNASGMSGTKMREAAKKGDFQTFRKGLPHTLTELDGKRLMNEIRQGSGIEAIKEQIKFGVTDLREKYHAGEIFNLEEIVESNGTVYQIKKRGSNHLLLQDEAGNLVSKWLQDVEQTTKEFKLQEGLLSEMKFSPSDKIKVARVIAAALGVEDVEKSSNPEQLVNNALRKVRSKPMRPEYVGVIHKMLETAKEAEIKYDEKLVPQKVSEELDEAHKIGTPVEITGGSGRGIKGHIGEIRHGAYKGAPKTYTVYHGGNGAIQVKKQHFKAIKEDALDELSTDLLSRYKTAASADASAADKKGDYERGNKRFKGLNKATNKQFDNDLKKHVKEEKTIKVTTKNGGEFDGIIKVTGKDYHIVKHPVTKKAYTVDHSGKTIHEELESVRVMIEALAAQSLKDKLSTVKGNIVTDPSKTPDPEVNNDSDVSAVEEPKAPMGSEVGSTMTHAGESDAVRKMKIRYVHEDLESTTEDDKEEIHDDPSNSTLTTTGGLREEEECSPEEEELDKLTDKDLEKMADTVDEVDDIIDAYEDEELAVVDDETGEHVEDLKEETEVINEILSRMERMKAKTRFAKTAAKRQRKLRIALKSRSSNATINSRARKLAVKLMKQRIARKPLSQLSVGEKERLEKMIQRRKVIINRLAMKLAPRVRKIESQRLEHKSYTK